MADEASSNGNMGAGMMGLAGFIAFLAVLWAVWAAHNRHSDHVLITTRAIDRVGYETGFTRKQLDDMQRMNEYNTAQDLKWREDQLRFGQPYGNHTQYPCHNHGRRFGHGHGFGGVVNGSQFTETSNFAAENSAFG